jgi:HAE1 family hydrophobic/amphiphilic exporter-1
VNPIGLFGTANQTPIQLIVKGKTYDEVYAAAERIKQITEETEGTADVRLSADRGKPELQVSLERDKMTTLGLSVAEVGATLRTALAGDTDSKFRQGGDEFDIRIQLDKFDRNKTENLGELTFMNRMGKQIALKQFAKITRSTGPSKLERKGRMPAIVVMSQVAGVPAGTLGDNIEKKINEEKLKKNSPIGKNIIVEYEGDLKNQRQSSGSMGTALLISIIFVYLIMVALYDSYVYPFVVLFSLPVAVIGAMLALALTLNNMGIFTMLGLIMLMGLVAKNAILLVDFTNQLRKEKGLGVYEALLEAGPARLRPILMTTLAMVFGMMPIAMAAGAGSEWKAGLAWSLIGGLSSSMLLTLVVVPIGYVVMTRVLHFVEKKTGLKIEPVQLPFENHTPQFPSIEQTLQKEQNTVLHVN